LKPTNIQVILLSAWKADMQASENYCGEDREKLRKIIKEATLKSFEVLEILNTLGRQ
jgi:hypothetical protein